MAKCGTKKMAVGGPVMPAQAAARPPMPAQANAGGAARGLARAGAMSGRAMPATGRTPVVMKKGGVVKKAGKK